MLKELRNNIVNLLMDSNELTDKEKELSEREKKFINEKILFYHEVKEFEEKKSEILDKNRSLQKQLNVALDEIDRNRQRINSLLSQLGEYNGKYE